MLGMHVLKKITASLDLSLKQRLEFPLFDTIRNINVRGKEIMDWLA